MNNERLSLEDLKRIDADSYGQNYLCEAAEVLMEAAADFVDLLILEEHYKIEYALSKIGMTAEQYVAVRSKNGKRWWKNGNEIEDEMKEEEEEEKERRRIDRNVLLPIWEKIKDGTIDWEAELKEAADNKTFAAILGYRNKVERKKSEDKVVKTLNLAKNGYLTYKEVLKCYPGYMRNEVKRIAKENGFDVDWEAE